MTEKPQSLENTQHGGNHYKGLVIEPAEYCQRNKLDFCESSAIKYLSRHHLKGGAEDLKKAIHFIQMVLEMEYGTPSEIQYGHSIPAHKVKKTSNSALPKEIKPSDPQWIVLEAKDENDNLIGYRVAWSEKDEQGRQWLVRHYLTDGKEGNPSFDWCLHVAEQDAKRFNEEGRLPEYFSPIKK